MRKNGASFFFRSARLNFSSKAPSWLLPAFARSLVASGPPTPRVFAPFWSPATSHFHASPSYDALQPRSSGIEAGCGGGARTQVGAKDSSLSISSENRKKKREKRN